MADLFAALGHDGTVRFVDEVSRGAACNCRCPECHSPLIAKQGEVKTWHFAHEPGQERPECEVGAANMLRRVAIELLRSDDSLDPPPHRVRVDVERGGRVWSTTVDLESARSEAWRWVDSPARRAPAATSRLSDGVGIELHVEVSQPPAECAGDVAVVSFVLSLPALEEMQSRAAVHRHVRDRGKWEWRLRPDPTGVVASEADRLTREAASASAAAEEKAQRAAGDRLHADEQAKALRDALGASILRSTPQRAAGASILFYRLRDGSSWLVYALGDGSAGLVQWPDGQTRKLVPPSHVGPFDEQLQIYRTTAGDAIMFLAPKAASVRNDSDPAALASWALTSGKV